MSTLWDIPGPVVYRCARCGVHVLVADTHAITEGGIVTRPPQGFRGTVAACPAHPSHTSWVKARDMWQVLEKDLETLDSCIRFGGSRAVAQAFGVCLALWSTEMG